MAQSLSGKKIAILATDGFEQAELQEPRKALRNAGAQVDIVAPIVARSRACGTTTRARR